MPRFRINRLKDHLKKLFASLDIISYNGRLLLKNAPFHTIVLLSARLVTGLTTPIVVWSINGLIDRLEGGATTLHWSQILPWLAPLLIAILLQSFDSVSSEYLASIIRERVDGAIHQDLWQKAMSVPLSAFESREYYNKLETAKRATSGHLVYVLESFAVLTSALVGATGLLLLFARAHWAIMIVLIATMILSSVIGARQSRQFVEVNYHSSPLRQEIGYWGNLLADRRAGAELRVLQLGPSILKRWREAFDRYVADIHAARVRLAAKSLMSTAIQELVSWVTTLALFLLATVGSITVGSMVALLYGVGRFRWLIQSFSWTIGELVEHLEQLKHLREYLSLPDENTTQTGTHSPPRPIRQGIVFHNVSFTYPGSETKAIAQLNLTLRPGERVALVGENGAGKTTFVRLLLGLYPPSEGKITVDGIRMTNLDLPKWRKEATAVFQDFMRYPATVHENIGFGDTATLAAAGSDDVPHPKVLAASLKSEADIFVRALPSQYRTFLGKEHEGGAELSTGQWQRLAMARAYLKDAQVIILDEPTSALDPRAEVEVYRQFKAASQGGMAVLISHRLGSARLADRILVLKEGRLIEDGTHEELMQLGGEYAHMVRLQAGWYETDGKEVAM